MMLNFDLSKRPGRWRPGPIFVRDESTGQRVYDAPPMERVPGLIDELIGALNAAKGNASTIIDAAMAHLNLVMIHPFSDGNGRMARCLQTLVLARGGVVPPLFSSIEEYLGRNTRDYYDVLGLVGGKEWSPDRSARPWVQFCLTAHYRQAHTLLRRTRELHKLSDELERIVREARLQERSVLALLDAASGFRVRNPTYRKAANATVLVAGRDLKALAQAGLLEARGEKRGRYYVAAPRIREIRDRVREPKSVADPFGKYPSFDEKNQPPPAQRRLFS